MDSNAFGKGIDIKAKTFKSLKSGNCFLSTTVARQSHSQAVLDDLLITGIIAPSLSVMA